MTIGRIVRIVAAETRRAVPAIVYFFFAFVLFRITFGEWLADFGQPLVSLAGVFVLALIVGKVVLLVDHLPLLSVFSRKPLIWTVLWKSSVYSCVCFLFRLLEHLLRFGKRYGDIGIAWREIRSDVFWPEFMTVQTWFFVLFFVFVFTRELIGIIGREKMMKLFFGALALFLLAAPCEAKSVDERIFIIPAQSLSDDRTVALLKSELPGMLPVTAKAAVEASWPLPENARDAARGQYDAAAVLDAVSRRIRLSCTTERALVVTDADLFVPGADFVYGFADAKKGLAIVSTARLRGATGDDRIFRGRVLKEASRALGASRGLGVCAQSACVMAPSPDIAAIDGKKSAFCHGCCKQLRCKYASPLFTMPVF